MALLGVAVVPPAWLVFGLEYTGRNRWVNRYTVALLSVLPAAVLVGGLVPSLRPLVLVLGPERSIGPLLVGFFLYYFVASLVVSALFLGLFVRAKHLYRTESAALLVATLTPWAGLAINVSDVVAPRADLTPVVLTVTGAAMVVALYRVRLLDPVPTAHEQIVENMGDGVVVLAGDDRIGAVNPAAAEMLDLDPGSVRGRPIGDVFEDWAAILGADEQWVERAREVGGERRYVELEVSPFHDYRDRRAGRLLVIRDVTGRKRREQTLARYKTVFDASTERVYVLDEAGRFIMVNDALASLLGTDPESLVGEPFESILAGDAPDDLAGRTDDPVEISVRAGEDEAIPCETRRAPVSFEGDRTGTVGFLRDISKRKRAQRDLAVTTERLETLVEAAPVAICAMDPDGVVEVWNPAAERIFGRTEAEVVGGQLPVVPEDSREELVERFERATEGERFSNFEVELERKDGQRIDATTAVAPVFDEDGEIDGIVAVAVDITARKEHERELERQKERLEKFAGVISHDLRNPLQVAAGKVDIVRKTGETDRLDAAAESLDRMSDLIEEVLTLAREGEEIGETGPVVIKRILRQSWDAVATDRATLELDDDLPALVEGDETRLRELFENLFRNAIEHGGETVTVRVGTTDEGLYVADDGPGIPEEKREDVLEAGYTTADDGTGFGLAIVRMVVQAHGWSLAVTEADSGGARFEIGDATAADPSEINEPVSD